MVDKVARVIAWLAVLNVGAFACVCLPQAALAVIGVLVIAAVTIVFATFLLTGGKWL